MMRGKSESVLRLQVVFVAGPLPEAADGLLAGIPVPDQSGHSGLLSVHRATRAKHPETRRPLLPSSVHLRFGPRMKAILVGLLGEEKRSSPFQSSVLTVILEFPSGYFFFRYFLFPELFASPRLASR